jgi:hypothetical protein
MAILALGVGGLLWLAKPWEPEETVEKKKDDIVKAIFDPKPEGVDRIEVVRRDRDEELTIVKDGESWRIVKPIEAPATEHQVRQNLFEKARDIKYVRSYEKGDKDRPGEKLTGLDTPRAVVRLFKGDKQVGEVRVGRPLPTGKGNYLQLGGADEVFESHESLTDAFSASLKEYRDLQVIKFDAKDVQKVTVTGGQTIVLTRDGDDWLVEKPVRGRADKIKADQLVSSLSSLRAVEFKPDAPAHLDAFGLEPPALQVVVEVEKEIPPKASPDDKTAKPADTQPTREHKTYTLLVGHTADPSAASLASTF